MDQNIQQRSRLQSVSLDGLGVEAGAHGGLLDHAGELAMLRRNMEAVSFDELSKLDDSNILKHLAKDVRLSSLEQLSRNAGQSQKNGSQASGGWNYLNNRNSPAFLSHNGGSQHGAFGSQTTIGAQTPSMGSQTTISAQTPVYITALAQQRKPVQNAQPDLTKSLAQFPTGGSSEAIIPSYEMLRDEVLQLRQEVEILTKKTARLPALEAEVEKIQQLYLSLHQSAERRDTLGTAVRSQLEREKQMLLAQNQQLRAQMEKSSLGSTGISGEQHQHVVRGRDVIIHRLSTENKELVEIQRRQDAELAAQRATLDEQRNHIHILESALSSAQTNVARLEEEFRRQQLRKGGLHNLMMVSRPRSNETLTPTRPEKLSSDSLSGESYSSSTEKLRSSEELQPEQRTQSTEHTPKSVRAVTTVTRTGAAVVQPPAPTLPVKRRDHPTLSSQSAAIRGHRSSLSNLVSITEDVQSLLSSSASSTTSNGSSTIPPGLQRPKSALGGTLRETRTEQWQV
ncbi:hypothetical protein RvY_02447 [Ramazzottius varieornatus]|uniref:Angiomotin C-terminal domain-containing protein n=1 Tax=Ramazzottius varieornatus TaxID=947166 RepID=A0A1D1URT5_RAMVA|nr:hypothetical protein RvY_02447 [Ramazzottius varieornatus]